MPKARRKQERILQVSRWLADKYPCAYPVVVQFEYMEDEVGSCDRIGKEFIISLDPKTRWDLMIMILIHEWAHARTWRHAVIEKKKDVQHDSDWGIAFAEIYRHFYELDGDEEANDY